MLWAPASARATWIACERTPALANHMLNAAQFHSTGMPSLIGYCSLSPVTSGKVYC